MPTTPVSLEEELMEIEPMDTQRPLLSIEENEATQMDFFPFQAMKLIASDAHFGSLNFLENPHNSESVQNHGILSQKSEVKSAYANVFTKQSANFELSEQTSMFEESTFHSQNMGSFYTGIPSDTNQLQGSNFIVCGISKKVLSSSSSTTLLQNNLPRKRTYSEINGILNETQYLSISSTTHQSPVNQETALHRCKFPNIGQFLTDLNQSKNSSFTFPSSNQQSSPTTNNRILPPNVISPFSHLQLMPSNKPVLPNCSPANASDGECGIDWTKDNSCQTAGVPEVTVRIEREITALHEEPEEANEEQEFDEEIAKFVARCLVCQMSGLDDDGIVFYVMKCGHVACKHCLRVMYRRKNARCPYCKRKNFWRFNRKILF